MSDRCGNAVALWRVVCPLARGLLLCPLLAAQAPLAAQEWNDSVTMALVRRAVAARVQNQPDSTLQSYRTRAHGFVLFLGQVGQDLEGEPRLIKADELDVEVYWRAPATSKQRILGWRDGRWLPTDISYHRDHLGIVTNNFGDLIRIGEGDEVRDVVHPLSPGGLALYDYRLSDSLRIRGREAELLVDEVEVRPRDRAAPRVVGTLSLDAATAELVRFRFSFTPAAYLDGSLEDIGILLENARYEDRWWLPYRQEIEIRRRVTWLDFPARSVIRGRWEIGDYALNVAVPEAVARGPAIGGLGAARDSGGTWDRPLAEAVAAVARPVQEGDLARLRREVSRIAGGRLTSGLPAARLGLARVSDLARVTRVQGLTLGLGLALRAGPGDLTVRPRVAFGTADGRLTGGLAVTRGFGEWTVTGEAGRTLRDIADLPIISGLVNSLLAQEGGRDHGDYALADQALLSAARRLGGSTRLGLAAGAERARAVTTEAEPASGRYRANPPLGRGTGAVLRLEIEQGAHALAGPAEHAVTVRLEGGAGDGDYARAALAADLAIPAGPGVAAWSVTAGLGTAALPAWRSFALGGWGTLPGEGFRAWGGRRALLLRAEYRVAVPFPAIPLGPFADTGPAITVAPFLASGWTGGAVAEVPWRPSAGARPVAGVALDWFHALLRVEAGIGLRTGRLGVSVDVGRAWWEVL